MKLFLLLFLSGGAICKQQSDDVLDLITQAGFEGEAHNVQTEDGYILRVHRILPRGKPVSKLPVFLMHGMLVYSSTFLMSAPENSFGYLLADAGFDVWMGNTRGTKFSMNHTSLSIESSEFWEFSFHEMGFYDLPAMIDFMLRKTGAEKCFYVGHSQGSSAMLVLLSMRPEYNEKVEQVHLAAPASVTNYMRNPFLKTLFDSVKSGIFGKYRYLNMNPGWTLLQELFCSKSPGTLEFAICEFSAFVVAGPNKRKFQMDKKAMQRFLRYMSPRLAVMQFTHFVQMYYSKKFQSFDHSWKNYEKENFTKPIEYNLSKITSPTFLYAGNVDAVVSDVDTKVLESLLPNVKKYQVVDDWNHYDFTFSKATTLYDMIIREMKAGNDLGSNSI